MSKATEQNDKLKRAIIISAVLHVILFAALIWSSFDENIEASAGGGGGSSIDAVMVDSGAVVEQYKRMQSQESSAKRSDEQRKRKEQQAAEELREKQAAEQERLKQLEKERLAAQEQKKQAEEAAKQAELKQKQAEEAAAKAAADAKAKAEADAKAAEEAAKKAAADAKKKAEAEAAKAAAEAQMAMRPAEEGMLLLCSTLSGPGAQPLSGAEFQALREKLAGQLPQEDPLQELTQGMLLRAGLGEQEAGRVLALLSRGERLSAYLAAAQRQGMSLVTRISPGYPARLRAGLGDDGLRRRACREALVVSAGPESRRLFRPRGRAPCGVEARLGLG